MSSYQPPPPPPPPPPPGGGFGYGYGGPPPKPERAVAPATTMMALTAVGMLFGVLGIVMNIVGTSFEMSEGSPGAFGPMASGAIGVVSGLIGLAVGAFALYGLNEMRNGRKWGLSLGAVIVSMIPCLGPCWCINIGVGVWALIVLNDAEVKNGFVG